MAGIYGFDEYTARELVRQLYETKHRVDSLARKVNRKNATTPRSIEYAVPKTTLQPGQSCEAYLMKYDAANDVFITDTTDTVTVKDLHSWSFAVGVDDYASTSSRLTIAKHPKARAWISTAPTGLIQQAEPDATIATGGQGTFSIYQDGTDTTVNVTAKVQWGDDAEGVSANKESWVRWNGATWEWIGGDCED